MLPGSCLASVRVNLAADSLLPTAAARSAFAVPQAGKDLLEGTERAHVEAVEEVTDGLRIIRAMQLGVIPVIFVGKARRGCCCEEGWEWGQEDV